MFEKLNEKLEYLLEFALDKNKVKTDLNNQMKPLFHHIAKLQLYGYDSDIVKTIYDIYSNLSDLNDTKIGRKYLTNNNVKQWLLDFVIDEDDYNTALKRLDVKFNYPIKERNISYDNFLNLQKYIQKLLVEDIIVEREDFYNQVVEILRIKK